MKYFLQCCSLLSVAIALSLLPLKIVSGQTNRNIITDKNFNRLVVNNNLSTEYAVPVMSPNDKLMTDFSKQNDNILSGWTLLQSVSGVVKAVSFVNPSVGYMAAELGVVYKTTDGGLNWTMVLNLGFPWYWYGIHAFTAQKVLIAGFNNTTGDGIMRWTYDGGTTWSDDIIVAPAPFNWIMGLGFADSLHGLAVGSILSSGIVFITDNGGTDSTDWTPVVADPTQGWFAGNFTMRTDGHYYITGISFCNSTDFGNTWARRNSIDNVFDGGVSFPDDLHGWTGGGSISPTVEGWAHRTTDGGNTWSSRILSTPYPIRVINFFDSQFGIAQGGEVNSGVGGIWESIDGGITWNEAQTTGLEMGSLDWQRVSADSIDVWSVGYTSSGGFHSVVYKKRFGYAIVPVELTSFTANISGNDVILNWTTASETNNRGFEVQRSEIGSQKSDWKAVGFVGGFGTTTESKSYSFTDNNISSGKYSYRLKQVDFDGSYKYSNIVEVEVNSVNEFALIQNYPNPFNPSTQINFNIPHDEFVSLKVYNSLGQEVANLVNEMSKAGSHEVTFNASNLSSGIYYYRIEAGKNISVKKMALLK
jgi:photosystem II stability/assembly factor-like uncharacterized protein